MSVLVRGMEMPETCVECNFHQYHSFGEYVCVATPLFYPFNLANYKGGRKEFCPLVEVQTPHGRLKDADAFDERVRVAGGMSEEELTEDFKDGVQTVLYMLSKQSTIIEAEGREE